MVFLKTTNIDRVVFCLCVSCEISGAKFSCALLDDSKVYCVGDNSYGQLSTSSVGSNTDLMTVMKDSLDNEILANGIAAGCDHTCIVYTGADVRCSGRNLNGFVCLFVCLLLFVFGCYIKK